MSNIISETSGFWADEDMDAARLAGLADAAAAAAPAVISAMPEFVPMLWAWLEKTGVKILSRHDGGDVKILSASVTAALRRGAAGVQIFADAARFQKFCAEISPVYDDLFFGKSVYFAMDIGSIGHFDFDDLFTAANKLGAAGFLFYLKNQDLDAAGKLYGLFDCPENNLENHFYMTNGRNIENAARLCEKMRPDKKLVFFN
ncbi:MAG: hypothetical protein LBO08_00020 [Rickettsiales bacterium]|jgi:hypothetical protein|nr:hypothetical protein [Rickettsiales bacterium]